MEVDQRFPRMQLVRKAAEQYQRLIMDCTRPTLAIHQQQQQQQVTTTQESISSDLWLFIHDSTTIGNWDKQSGSNSVSVTGPNDGLP